MNNRISTVTDISARGYKYTPAAIGNGDLSLLIDYEGMQRQSEPAYGKLIPNIRRAGYRYNTLRGELISFGYFLTEIPGSGEAVSFCQSLDFRYGRTVSVCTYADGTSVHAETFCCLHRNIVVLKRRIDSNTGREFRFRYFYNPENAVLNWHENGMIEYDIKGLRRFQGFIRLECDAPFSFRKEKDSFVLSTESRNFTLLMRFDDDAFANADSLFKESCEKWDDYWQEGYVHIPSEDVQRTYDLAQYHLRISSTAWGLPTGIYDSHWHGRYHAFDEYFTFMGLATSGHLETALKIPAFRSSLYDTARRRIEGAAPQTETGVIIYPWETNELCEENSPRGFWYDHIFHASHIALTAYNAYLFTGDKARLRSQWYRLITGSVEWLRRFHIVPGKDGIASIGCCTDLERLGPMKKNPFMTACSVIAALDAVAECAEKLEQNTDLIPLWKRLAQELRRNLPKDGIRYLPYEGCSPDVHSIGQLAGIYPYGILSDKDPLQAGARHDYLNYRSSCGNMYENSKTGICSWYLCWEALAESTLGNGDRSAELLEGLSHETGCFGELFEIYSSDCRPWFTTAEGELVHAVNQMLLQFSPDGSPKIAPAVPASWRDFEFRLQGHTGSKVEAVFRNGVAVKTESIPGGEK